MVVKSSDQWQTPQWLFDELNAEFNFNIDLCATKENRKCDLFCEDYLTNSHLTIDEGNFVIKVCKGVTADITAAFMNPPYSNPRPFVEKAFRDAKENKVTIVCLLKCDPSTKTWAVIWDYNTHKPKLGVEVRFLPKRVKFTHLDYCTEHHGPDKDTIYCLEHDKLVSNGPTFPSCVVIFRGHEMS